MRTKILVIDDDNQILEWFRATQFHMDNEYSYFFLDDGSKIMDAVKRIAPDVIILDVNLNSLSGPDAAEVFHYSGIHLVPIVYMSTTSWFRSTPDFPKDKFMAKPLSRKKVDKKIRTALKAA